MAQFCEANGFTLESSDAPGESRAFSSGDRIDAESREVINAAAMRTLRYLLLVAILAAGCAHTSNSNGTPSSVYPIKRVF